MSSSWKPNAPSGGFGATPVHQKLVPVGQNIGTWGGFNGVSVRSIWPAWRALNSPVSSAKMLYWIWSAAGPEMLNWVGGVPGGGIESARAGSKTAIDKVKAKTASIPTSFIFLHLVLSRYYSHGAP